MSESRGSPDLGARPQAAGRTLVLALGNPLRGDDGVGPAVLESLAQSGALPPEVTLVDGGSPGPETALLLEGFERAILVDAAELGEAPGSWACFDPTALAGGGNGGSLHAAGLREALALCSALGCLPPSILLFGIQPAAMGWAPGLSEAVRRAVPAVSRAILDVLGEAQV